MPRQLKLLLYMHYSTSYPALFSPTLFITMVLGLVLVPEVAIFCSPMLKSQLPLAEPIAPFSPIGIGHSETPRYTILDIGTA